MATCRMCGRHLPAATASSPNGETLNSWRAERVLRFMFFPARQPIVLSGLIASYAPLAFLTVVVLAIGAGVAWLALFADWSYLQEQNLAIPIIVTVLMVAGVLVISSFRILESVKSARYCPSCLAYLSLKRTQRFEELGPHKVKTRKI
jgi:hypothetical protein